jgi:hypothetical protein
MCESTELRICWSVHVKTCSFLRTWWQVTSSGSTGTARPGDRTAIVTVERSLVSATKEGARGGKQNKSHVTYIFFYSEGIVNHYYAPDGQSINKEFYPKFLRLLRKSVRRKQLEKWRDGDWILHHDNVHARTHFTSCAALFSQTRHCSALADVILTRPRTVWLFPIPKA